MRSEADATDRLLRRAREAIDLVAPTDVLTAILVTQPGWASIWFSGGQLEGFARFEHASGNLERFAIAIAHDEAGLRVFEREPRRIALDCPGRHLYPDGSFCLGYRLPTARASSHWARAWWSLLGGYIELQVVAEILGEWPEKHSWPHTTEGASTQAELERRRANLDAGVLEWLSKGHAEAPRDCPCGSGSPFDGCHGSAVAAIRALEEKRACQDREYWERRAGQQCCGVLRACPLRRASDLFRG